MHAYPMRACSQHVVGFVVHTWLLLATLPCVYDMTDYLLLSCACVQWPGAYCITPQPSCVLSVLSPMSYRYLGAMQGALDTNQRGTEHRLAALEQVQALLARLDAVSVAYNALKVRGCMYSSPPTPETCVYPHREFVPYTF